MAVIKCRYRKNLCANPYGEYFRQDVEDFCYDRWTAEDSCACYRSRGSVERPYDGDSEVFKGAIFKFEDEACVHLSVLSCEFEKTVKKYELAVDDKQHPTGIWREDTGYLRIGKTVISMVMIDYLEVDGRIIKGEEGI